MKCNAMNVDVDKSCSTISNLQEQNSMETTDTKDHFLILHAIGVAVAAAAAVADEYFLSVNAFQLIS